VGGSITDINFPLLSVLDKRYIRGKYFLPVHEIERKHRDNTVNNDKQQPFNCMAKQQNKNPDLVKANELRGKVKQFVVQELERLPETLEKLDAKDRLNVLLKLLPLVVARPQAVIHSEGEPFSFDY